jgi:deoxyxylulose-5-phosphate synthase
MGQDESESSYIKRRFAEAVDEDMLDAIDDQLREEGFASDKIRPRKSECRKELKKQTKSTTALARASGQRSAEDIIDNLSWPVSINGEVDPVFVAGMRYEAMNVIRGIRMAQELNKMGLEQAKPVIEMAKEMRQAEGQAAQTIAAQFGQVTMQSNQQIIGAIHELAAQSQGQPSETNPMAKMVFNALQPYMGQLLAQVFSSVNKQRPGAQPQGSQQPLAMPDQPAQAAAPDSAPPSCMKPGEEDEFTEA